MHNWLEWSDYENWLAQVKSQSRENWNNTPLLRLIGFPGMQLQKA